MENIFPEIGTIILNFIPLISELETISISPISNMALLILHFKFIRNCECISGKYGSHNYIIRGGADTSLARPTSRCRRTESIVSFETGVSSCAELQIFLVTEAERKHVGRRELSNFLFLQGKALKEFTPFRQKP